MIPDDIVRAVAARYLVSSEDLLRRSRTRSHVRPRHLAMHLIRQHTHTSVRGIARMFDNRNAGSVGDALGKVAAEIATEPAVAAEVADIEACLRGRLSPSVTAELVAEIDGIQQRLTAMRALLTADGTGVRDAARGRDGKLIEAAAHWRGARARANRPKRLPAEDTRT